MFVGWTYNLSEQFFEVGSFSTRRVLDSQETFIAVWRLSGLSQPSRSELIGGQVRILTQLSIMHRIAQLTNTFVLNPSVAPRQETCSSAPFCGLKLSSSWLSLSNSGLIGRGLLPRFSLFTFRNYAIIRISVLTYLGLSCWLFKNKHLSAWVYGTIKNMLPVIFGHNFWPTGPITLWISWGTELRRAPYVLHHKPFHRPEFMREG